MDDVIYFLAKRSLCTIKPPVNEPHVCEIIDDTFGKNRPNTRSGVAGVGQNVKEEGREMLGFCALNLAARTGG